MRVLAYRVLAAVFALVALMEGVDHEVQAAAPHRIHVTGHGVVSGALVLALLSQVLRSRPPAGLHLLAVIGVGAGLGDLLGQRFGALEVVCAVFLAVLVAVRPDRSELWQRPTAADRVTLWAGLVLLLAVAPYFAHESALQRHLVDPDNPTLGYWSWAGTAPLVLAGVLLVAGLRTRGWQLLVGVTSLGLLTLGLASCLLPHEPGSWGVAGGVAGIAGSLVTVWTGVQGRTLATGEHRLAHAS